MLRYLNTIDFAPYGKVSWSCGFENRIQRLIADTQTDKLTSFSRPVSIDIVSGLCALCVYDNDTLHTFLLDKPVMLKENCFFALVAVDKPCVVSICTEGKKRTKNLRESFAPKIHAPLLVIHDIVTFFYQEQQFGLRRTPESHSFFELTYVDSGSIVCAVDGKEHTVEAGGLMLFFPSQTHIQTSCSSSVSSFITISFNMTCDSCEVLKDKVFKADPVIKNIYSGILSEYEVLDMYSPDMLAGYLHQIILRLLRRTSSPVSALPFLPALGKEYGAAEAKLAISNHLVKNAVDYIDMHLDKKLSLSDIAETLKLNPSYIARLFKQHTNMCVTQYIKIRKLGRAKQLLKSGGFTVTEISDMLGFSSIHYFSCCFKKEFGISPSLYANMLRG